MPPPFFRSVRRCRRLLAGSATPADEHPLRAHTRRFTAAQTLTRAFYAFLLYQGVSQLTMLGDLFPRRAAAPLWPVAWLFWTDGPAGIRALSVFFTASGVLGVFFAGWRVARLAAFLGVLEYVALKNSYGKIGHSLHLTVIVAGVLVFLPAGWTRPATSLPRRPRQQTLLVVWLAQAAILLSYTMSGLGKLGGAAYQLALGQRNAFSPGALGAHVAQRLVQTGSRSALGDWIIHHPFLTWPLLPAAVAVETFAFLAAFRPSLGRPLAALLVIFHLGTYFTMTITFPVSCLLLALFFVGSPFEPTNPDWKTWLFGVPFARRAVGRRKAEGAT